MSTWNILYRGPLSSCNYGCSYCPFAKTSNTREELLRDEAALGRFADWAARQDHRIGILITPWGEAFVHRAYRETMVRLSRLPHVHRVAIQTNLSSVPTGLDDANRASLALWTTFHPTQTSIDSFLHRCGHLDALGIRYSVGVVGLREHFDAITELRQRLPPHVYLWINAYKRVTGYYLPEEIHRLLAIDPHFHFNLHRYPSAGTPCRAGHTSFTVDGDGNIRRCHFIDRILGNIHTDDVPALLRPTACTAATCGCHIGYVHRPDLPLYELFGDGLLERIPHRSS
jgi:MoaA/NifB/PqqE/SkfB family radical SAM enzyme